MKTKAKVCTIDIRFFLFSIAIGAVLSILLVSGVFGMPPHPQVQEQIDAGLVKEPFVESAQKVGAVGPQLNSASKFNSAQITGPFKALCILVEFSDHASQVSSEFFDTLIFENQPNTVQDYYDEISYGQIDIVAVTMPSDLNWQLVGNPYTYYVAANYGTGSYPFNSQKLCEDLVDLVDHDVDFSDYDNDNDGYVDVVMIVHSGPGAEYTGSVNDIWSHKWGIVPRSKDGKFISNYTIMPEYWSSPGDMTIGVFCHELGHAFGLPDLYDTDGSSVGVGRYSLMAGGSWNGPLGNSPAHPDAWSRVQLGWCPATTISSNQSGASIPNVEQNQSIFRLWTNGSAGNEYFLVENRQKTGYDSYLPGAGLCIWHIDESKSDNEDEWYPGHTASGNYLVALEQADNLYSMEKNSSNGDAGDVYPGSTNNTAFNASSSPSSDSYSGAESLVSVTNISASASTMTADFMVSLAADVDDDGNQLPSAFGLEQNYPNPFNPTTKIRFTLAQSGDISLKIYNVLGEQVKTLEESNLPAGTYERVWDGTTSYGEPSPSGIYFYELTADENSEVRKMLLVK
ncbi:MAG: M6 family metalloprotease domain-containing protein [Candidatus Zixiibacteriota bacterium]